MLLTDVPFVSLRLRLHQYSDRQSLDIRHSFSLRQCFGQGPARGPHRQAQRIKSFGWNAIPTDVQAANNLCDLFRHSFPIKNLSPMCAPGLLCAARAYLDACVFLGLDTPVYREKLNILMHILTAHGETWTLSRKVVEEVREVQKEYLSMPPGPSPTHVSTSGDAMWLSGAMLGNMADDVLLTTEFDFPLYSELDHLGGWAMHSDDHAINV
jgi:hypothetical protein